MPGGSSRPSHNIHISMKFRDLAFTLSVQNDRVLFEEKLLALDPGETTGFATYKECALIDAGQLDTKDFNKGIAAVAGVIDSFSPSVIVVEDYRIYSWKAKDHTWSDLHTPQFIGSIRTLAALSSIPLLKQSAQVAKQFCTNDKLKEWGYYRKAQPHARDAIRHGCYFLLFNSEKIKL